MRGRQVEEFSDTFCHSDVVDYESCWEDFNPFLVGCEKVAPEATFRLPNYERESLESGKWGLLAADNAFGFSFKVRNTFWKMLRKAHFRGEKLSIGFENDEA